MWRSFFIALGFAGVLLGGELLAIEKATLTMPSEGDVERHPFLGTVQQSLHSRDFVPPDWAPWTLLSGGAMVVLYSCSITKP